MLTFPTLILVGKKTFKKITLHSDNRSSLSPRLVELITSFCNLVPHLQQLAGYQGCTEPFSSGVTVRLVMLQYTSDPL